MKALLPLLLVCSSFLLQAQTKHSVEVLPKTSALEHQRFSFYWGYNRASYSTSNLHFNGPNYDFTVYDAVAHDRPTKFDPKVYFGPTTVSIPQYVMRFGYYFKPRWSVSIGVDHMKYVMDDLQTRRVSGVVSDAASTQYAGTYLNDTMLVRNDFLSFEHTDGLNLSTLELSYHLPLLRYRGLQLDWYNGVGGLWVITRTDVRVFGKGLNTDFHLSGYALTGKTGLQLFLYRGLFIQAENKFGYITLPDVLLLTPEAPDRADHHFTFWEKSGAVGWRFRIGGRKKG